MFIQMHRQIAVSNNKPRALIIYTRTIFFRQDSERACSMAIEKTRIARMKSNKTLSCAFPPRPRRTFLKSYSAFHAVNEKGRQSLSPLIDQPRVTRSREHITSALTQLLPTCQALFYYYERAVKGSDYFLLLVFHIYFSPFSCWAERAHH